jgi:hypothetical protein
MLEPLLIAQLHAAEVQDRVLHCAGYSLSAAGFLAMNYRCQDARHQMNTGAGIADLRTSDHGEAGDFTRR